MRRNLAAARVAVLSELEYRFNFLLDAAIQPLIISAVEVVIWSAILAGVGGQLGGYSTGYYLAYAMWANFLGRATANWMYEFKMIDEIDSGRVNSILVRPISFYEYYLSQFVGYKLAVPFSSFVFPIVGCLWMDLPFHLERVPLMLLLTVTYLLFVHTLSFTIACMAFFINRSHSFTGIKNIILWVLAGELVPLDLYPEPLRTWLISMPFAAGVYVPAGYVSGRFGTEVVLKSFGSVILGTMIVGIFATLIWRRGLRAYTGTGA